MAVGDLRTFHRTPILAVAIDDAFARDGYVGSVDSTERRLTTTRIEALEGCLDDRIESLIGSKLDDGASLQMQVDIVFEHDGTREPYALRHHKMASATLRQRLDGPLERLGAELGAGTVGIEVGKIHRSLWEVRSLYLSHCERQVGRVLFVRVRSKRRQGTCQGKHQR